MSGRRRSVLTAYALGLSALLGMNVGSDTTWLSKFFDDEGKLNHFRGHIRLARDASRKDKAMPSSFWDGGIGDRLGLNRGSS